MRQPRTKLPWVAGCGFFFSREDRGERFIIEVESESAEEGDYKVAALFETDVDPSTEDIEACIKDALYETEACNRYPKMMEFLLNMEKNTLHPGVASAIRHFLEEIGEPVEVHKERI
jgi:hypothetical protein